MPTVIEIIQEQEPPNARWSLVVDDEPIESIDLCLANSIMTGFAGAWLDGQRLYDTEVWWVRPNGERVLSNHIPPKSPEVDYSYDRLVELNLGPKKRRTP